MPRIVVIGGVAAGTSAASQAKRRQPGFEVVLLERGPFVSYGACGIPYNLQDPARSMDDLVVISPERFRCERHIDLRLRHEVLAIEPEHKRVRVRDLDQHRDYLLSYDKLVITTGAQATRLQVAGAELPGVVLLRELCDGEQIKRTLAERRSRSALLVGGGYIAMEMAEALRARGLTVTVLEKGPQLLPGFDRRITELVHEELGRHDVRVETDIELQAIERQDDDRALLARTSRGEFTADLVVISVGVRPNVALAKAAGIQLGKTGAIQVDAQQRTSVSDVWAAGDCAEAKHRVSDEQVWIPLGTTANKQGKVAGANAAGANDEFHGIVGTAAFKVFEMQVAKSGLDSHDITRLDLQAVTSVSEQPSRAQSVGGGEPIRTVVYAEQSTERLLGAQMAGRDGVAHRIDVIATALHVNMTLEDVEALDLAYAPPFAPVYDPILIAATVARKAARDGTTERARE
jgi:NADPH-dependent 2,4-dienoyl-CoA reductase/sulfur reductase-like enzyme